MICSRFIKGFMTRNQPACVDNSEYLAYVRQNYLTRLRENLPKTVLEKDSWLTPPPIMKEVCDIFSSTRLHVCWAHVGNYGNAYALKKCKIINNNNKNSYKTFCRRPSFWRSSTFATWYRSMFEESLHRGKHRYNSSSLTHKVINISVGIRKHALTIHPIHLSSFWK